MESPRKNSDYVIREYPLVSIITVNYNQTEVTRELLQSLQQITYPAFEIIVVDNGSRDDSVLALKEEFREITVIQTGKNLGFAGGNNVGIRRGKGEYFLLINNDVIATQTFLEPLVDALIDNEDGGLASPRILYYGKDELIQYAGAVRINSLTGRGRKIGHLQHDRGQYNSVTTTALGHGACLLISNKVLKSVGLLPEVYFLYYEEHDFAEQAKAKGFGIYYVGTSKVYHKESVSIGKANPLKTFYQTRNRILYLKRNSSPLMLAVFLLFFFVIAVPKRTVKYLLKKDFENLRAYFTGISAHFSFQNYGRLSEKKV
jgi:GT2 family glycosyltransferase